MCEQYRKDASVMNPAEECGITMTPATQYTVSFPVAGTIDLAASIRKDNSSLWLDVRAGVQSYLQCFNTDWGSADCWVQIILNRGGMSIEAVVTDYSGNGSSTATLERAAALSQGSKAGALFASLPEALFKALGPVTVSAPRKEMVIASVHYPDGEPPENPPPPTAPPSEPVAKAAWPDVETTIYGIDIDAQVDNLNPYGPDYWFKVTLTGLPFWLGIMLGVMLGMMKMMHHNCKNKLVKVEVVINNVVFDIVKQELPV